MLLGGMLVLSGCGSGASPSDMSSDLETPDMSPDSASDMPIVEDLTPDMPDMDMAPLALCDPEPANWPSRPKWGELTTGHPDYQNVMNNFNVLDSLRLLASMMDKAVKGIDAITNAADNDAKGHCVCNCNAFGTVDWASFPSNPLNLDTWANAQGASFEAQCYDKELTRLQCITKCDGVMASNFSPGPINTDKNFIWAPSDVLVDPGLNPKYALKLINFLDEVTGFLSTSGACMMDSDCTASGAQCHGGMCKSGLRIVLDSLSMAGANLTMTVQMVIMALEDISNKINRFTEGFHLGGYSTQRPDLHMCVGWAGHGAYAQMGNLGGDKFSIGARYTSHQLSYKHRAQFRSGGFGLQAFGKGLSLLPTPEANIQIDGFKVWNSDKPFGLTMPAGGIPVSGIEQYDVFHLVDSSQLADLASSDGDPSTITAGELLIQNYYPATYNSASDMATYTWPRSMDVAPKPWLPWYGYEQEHRSTAVFSAGLNLPLAIEPIEKTLPSIPIFPPFASLEPYFRLGAGVEWIHQDFRFRNRIQDMINANIPSAAHLGADDFAREMHALQAPDVTEDNGTTAFVEPELGANLVFGLQLSKFARLGLTASLGIGVNVKPGGWGGLIDMNHALVKALINSNPPADEPCTPILSEETNEVCSNKFFEKGKTPTYQCSSDGVSSCCMTIGDVSLCVEDWTGMDKSICESLNTVSGDPDKINNIIGKLSGFVGPKVTAALLKAAQAASNVSATWNEGKTCNEANCKSTIPVPSMDSLSQCEQHGYCADAQGNNQVHNVTEAECRGTDPNGPSLGRCCTRFVASKNEYGAISCGSTEEACENQGGVFVAGGVCTANVNKETCANPDDARVGKSDLIWTPYQCVTQTTPKVEGWEGPGCHPLTTGYQSACSCQSDSDCVSGETCNVADGLCEGSAGYACLCDPSDSSSCDAGRTCIEGACMKSCTSDAECPSSLTCADNVCQPAFDIPTAEELIWATQNPTSPIHAVSTYALSDLTVLAFLSFGLDVGLQLKLFGKTFRLDLLDLHKLVDLGSTNKTWYQAGLEARYQSECVSPDEQLVSNRMPAPLTSDFGLDIPSYGLFSGYVNRYPDPNNTSLDPNQDGNACNPTNSSACTWEDLNTFCKDNLSQNVFNPPAPEPSDLTNSFTDLVNFGEEVGLQVWQSGQMCIDGQPWYMWVQNQNTSLENLQCMYTDPQTGAVTTFPCDQAPLSLLNAFGCLDTDLNTRAVALAAAFGPAITTNGGAQFDPAAMMIDPTGEFTASNIKPIYLYGAGFSGYFWMTTVEQCFAEKIDEASQCACTTDADCPNPTNTCDPSGVCLTDQGSLESCSPVQLVAPPTAELCCGDGILQAGEACDDGNTTPGDGCSTYCTLEKDQEKRGACCMQEQQMYTCAITPSEAACKKNPENTFYPGLSCDQIKCPR